MSRVRALSKQEVMEFHELALATAMLVGEPQPVFCSCCGGKRAARTIFGHRTCVQCAGSGYDIMCSETAKALGLYDQMVKEGYYIGGR